MFMNRNRRLRSVLPILQPYSLSLYYYYELDADELDVAEGGRRWWAIYYRPVNYFFSSLLSKIDW